MGRVTLEELENAMDVLKKFYAQNQRFNYRHRKTFFDLDMSERLVNVLKEVFYEEISRGIDFYDLPAYLLKQIDNDEFSERRKVGLKNYKEFLELKEQVTKNVY